MPDAGAQPRLDLDPIAAEVLRFLGRFHDPPCDLASGRLDGAFGSGPGGPPDLYGAADAAYALWTLDELESLSETAGRATWAARIQAHQDPATGWFDRSRIRGHGVPHATAFATGALALLGAGPSHPLVYGEALFASRETVEAWLDGFRWSQIWTGSHAAGAAAALLDAPEGVALPADWHRTLLDALSARADAHTGLWKRGPLDRLVTRATAIDLGGAAHFWWLYERLGRPIPHPERALDTILGLQRRSGLWGSRLFGGDFPHGLDFDALFGLRAAWSDCGAVRRSERRGDLLRAIEHHARAAHGRLVGPGSIARLFRAPHKLVGTLNALAELDRLFLEVTGRRRLAALRPWRSALTRVSWQ